MLPSPAHTAALSLAWRLPGCPSSPSVALQALPVAAPPPSSSAARQLTPMAAAPVASQAQAVLRGRLCDPAFVHSRLRSSPDTNYSKLKYLVSSSVSEACNNSVLLLGPRGCGKGA
uniref:Uncharacterized protein n=1 Tax=Aegilops tauschii subsp. strangulata TaxID=200361 RepID=A0A453FD22_AEGTS